MSCTCVGRATSGCTATRVADEDCHMTPSPQLAAEAQQQSRVIAQTAQHDDIMEFAEALTSELWNEPQK